MEQTVLPRGAPEWELEQHLQPNQFNLPPLQVSRAQKWLIPSGGAHSSGGSQDLVLQSSDFWRRGLGMNSLALQHQVPQGWLTFCLDLKKGIKKNPAE